MYYVWYTGRQLFINAICISAIFEFLTRAFTMQGCGELTDFAHFTAFPQCLLCSAEYKLSDLKYVF